MKLFINQVYPFISKEEIEKGKEETISAFNVLNNGTGKGSDFLGWLNLPTDITENELKDIESTAAKLREQTDVVVVVGIGGSYLGAKSVIESLSHSFSHLQSDKKPLVLFAGHNISEDYFYELLETLDNKRYGIIVISKSGTTTEPAIAFRLLKNHLESKVGKEKAKSLIVAITDAQKGALRTLAGNEGYKTFVIPDDVGGRFSVLTPVGLLPIAAAGFDIKALVDGAKNMKKLSDNSSVLDENPVLKYALVRNLLYRTGKQTEILVTYENKLVFIAEWWKQLYGESEGKENQGILPASVTFTTDLHSMGQYIQDGLRNIFETVISVKNTKHTLTIPNDSADLDKLNFIAGKRINEVNKKAETGTLLAHVDGGVPNLRIEIDRIDEYCLGELLYFFERACGVSGYMLGVNPFDQPGVEEYKKNMFALLGKPGFEKERDELNKRINQ